MGGSFVTLLPDGDVRKVFEKFCFVQVHPPENRAYVSWSLSASEDTDQFRINLGGSSYTVTDYAYIDVKVVIYIDGLSRNLHGDPGNKVKDRRLRAVLVERGWKPLVISAQGLKDPEVLRAFLETIRTAIE